MAGALRIPCSSPFGPPSCAASALAGEWPRAASWQLAHDCRPEAESDGSWKIFSPTAAAAERVAVAGASVALVVPPPPHAATDASSPVSPIAPMRIAMSMNPSRAMPAAARPLRFNPASLIGMIPIRNVTG